MRDDKMNSNIKAGETKDRILLTLEKRLARSARSQASSPEAAARLVERFSQIPDSFFFF